MVLLKIVDLKITDGPRIFAATLEHSIYIFVYTFALVHFSLCCTVYSEFLRT